MTSSSIFHYYFESRSPGECEAPVFSTLQTPVPNCLQPFPQSWGKGGWAGKLVTRVWDLNSRSYDCLRVLCWAISLACMKLFLFSHIILRDSWVFGECIIPCSFQSMNVMVVDIFFGKHVLTRLPISVRSDHGDTGSEWVGVDSFEIVILTVNDSLAYKSHLTPEMLVLKICLFFSFRSQSGWRPPAITHCTLFVMYSPSSTRLWMKCFSPMCLHSCSGVWNKVVTKWGEGSTSSYTVFTRN